MVGRETNVQRLVSRCVHVLGLAGFLVVGSLPAASAQDLSESWSGPYVGLSFGTVRSNGEAERARYSGALLTLDVQNGLFPSAISGSKWSAIGGVGIGTNVQRGAFLGGLEVDVSALAHNHRLGFSRVDPNPSPPFTGIDTNTAYRTEFGAMATLRARGGYAAGRNLYYATAGLAAGRVRNTFSLDLPDLGYASPDWSHEGTLMGYTIGAGVERQLTDRLSLKAEVQYVDLADRRIEATDPVTFPGERIDYRFKNQATTVRIGLNLSF